MSLRKKFFFIFILLIMCSQACFAAVPELYSTSAILLDADSGYILASKNMSDKIYPASTTKVLTSILAIEHLDLDSAIVVTKSGVNIPWDSSKVYLKEGEVISVKNLLYCTLITSGNDAANMLGESVSGSIDEFVKLMNQKALELGCKNTHFVNAHGYHNKDHYTTAEDMSIILRYAIQNDTFREICESKTYTVPKTNMSEERKLTNTNRLILSKNESIHAIPYEYALGGKTGYTGEAGRCLVGWAKKLDKNLICCVFGAPTDGSQDKRFLDTISLFEYGFNHFEHKNVISKDQYSFEILDKEKGMKYIIGLDKDINILTDSEFKIKEIGYSLDFDSTNDIQDVEKKQGKFNVSFFVKDMNNNVCTLYGTTKLLSKSTYSEINLGDILTTILIICIILFAFILLFVKLTNNKNSSRRTRSETRVISKRKITDSSRKARRRRV